MGKTQSDMRASQRYVCLCLGFQVRRAFEHLCAMHVAVAQAGKVAKCSAEYHTQALVKVSNKKRGGREG